MGEGTTWQERANKRRDARQTKSPNEVPKPGVANARKDTKKWCRGKVGREHKPKCMDYDTFKTLQVGDRVLKLGWKILACTVCGKELERWYPIRSRKNNPKPDWVTP